MIRYRILPHRWVQTDHGFEPRLEEILRSWEGTPWRDGAQIKGQGVDCVRFVCAVLDELAGRPYQMLERLPHQTALHQPRLALRALRAMVRRFPEMRRLRGELTIEPGDLLIVSSWGGGPGHVLIAGARPNTLWQAGSRAVMQGGCGLVSGHQQLTHHYRCDRKEELWQPQ